MYCSSSLCTVDYLSFIIHHNCIVSYQLNDGLHLKYKESAIKFPFAPSPHLIVALGSIHSLSIPERDRREAMDSHSVDSNEEGRPAVKRSKPSVIELESVGSGPIASAIGGELEGDGPHIVSFTVTGLICVGHQDRPRPLVTDRLTILTYSTFFEPRDGNA